MPQYHPELAENQVPLRLGIAGLGTVGVSVIKIIEESAVMLSARAGRQIVVQAVSARSRTLNRGVRLDGYVWCDDPLELARRDDIDCVLELIGGSDGPALELVRAALVAGKSVVTANKALLATHGAELALLAEQHGVALRFEAAVAGGIPLIKAVREGLVANDITRIAGILNGTCNYILSRMTSEGGAFEGILSDAQRLGYAEADPTFDIDGTDTAHKIVLLASLAFATAPQLSSAVAQEGIQFIAPVDIDYARELGLVVKLLGVAERVGSGYGVRIGPAMVPRGSPLAPIEGPTNAVLVEGDRIGQCLFSGPGAGGAATASAVVADVVDIMRGRSSAVFGVPAAALKHEAPILQNDIEGMFYIRLRVKDQSGVMADISRILADMDVSIESLLQRGRAPMGGVYVVLTTHTARTQQVESAVSRLNDCASVIETPTLIRIENFQLPAGR